MDQPWTFVNAATTLADMTSATPWIVDVTSADPSVSDRVAQQVRRWRRLRDLTAVQLAERCARQGYPDLTAQKISNIETGRRDATGARRRHITVDELFALALGLEVPPIYLLVGSDLVEEDIYWLTPGVAVDGVMATAWAEGRWPITYARQGPDVEGLTPKEFIRKFHTMAEALPTAKREAAMRSIAAWRSKALETNLDAGTRRELMEMEEFVEGPPTSLGGSMTRNSAQTVADEPTPEVLAIRERVHERMREGRSVAVSGTASEPATSGYEAYGHGTDTGRPEPGSMYALAEARLVAVLTPEQFRELSRLMSIPTSQEEVDSAGGSFLTPISDFLRDSGIFDLLAIQTEDERNLYTGVASKLAVPVPEERRAGLRHGKRRGRPA